MEIYAALVVRARTGLGLLLSPEDVVSAIGPPEAVDKPTIIAARVLGARHLGEAAVLSLRPSHRVLLAGVAVDAIHAASMVGTALLIPTHRRPALASAASAAGLVALGATRAGARRSSSH